ncbi:MAG: DMT family transporter [Chloroflexi bacterium]|nr:DMT family transporter [Chloroflexota bacterium]
MSTSWRWFRSSLSSAGQIYIEGKYFLSVIVDQFGLLDVPKIPITLPRVLGVVFLVVAAVLIARK